MFLLNYCKIFSSFFILALYLFLYGSSFAQETVPNQEFKSNNSVNNVRTLNNRLDSLEKSLQDISRVIYKRDSNIVSGKENFNKQGSSGTSPFIQRMTANELRMSELETELRRLTGAVETAGNDVIIMRERIDKLVEDLDLRLKSIENIVTNLKAIPRQNKDLNQNTQTESGLDNDLKKDLNGSTYSEAKTSKVESFLPNSSPEKQYAFARSLLMKLDYQAAELAFKEFIQKNKDHKLSSNAYYWLGEVYYVKKSFAEAAGAFIDSYKLFPLGNKAPDSLLKLGMSLAELGNSNEACESFEELLLKFPEANSRIRRRALQESVRIGCKN
ncbi:MAG: hypothetical protein CFH01_00704 [Alphaproteobacteria bacterium MarineAlpha2_Bin1]|nr:MAG: hypothetical protein CFH01_00704 [Alphaproteobacteria bacterium MarineAlpha2_Bin1]|tara:strand:- start:136 stop:1122 length:987 start_codon:yes stop_codon:yes gene_type:complete